MSALDIADDITIAWAFVEMALYDHLYEPDLQAARAFYAALAAHSLPGLPVWPMLVAPPSNGKTELINPLDGLPDVHLIDSVTPQTFISGRIPEKGQKRGKEGLLERIGSNGLILFPDFSTVLEGNRDKRDDIFAQLRRIYDGKLRREFGTEVKENSWEGRITVGAAVTPAVDKYSTVFSSLGDRFVMVRWPRVDGIEAAAKAMDIDRGAMTTAIRTAVHRLFALMDAAPIPQLDTATKKALAAVAEIIAISRTPVERDYRDKTTLLYDPMAEGNFRLAQQLCQVAKGSARLEGRDTVTDSDIAIAHRVAFDTLTPARAAALRACAANQKRPEGMSRTTAWRAFRDLEELGAVVGGEDVAHALSETFKRLWLLARVDGQAAGS